MRLNPPRVPEVLAGAFSALLAVSLFLPWYRASEPAPGCDAGRAGCPRETATAFEAFAAIDILLLLVAGGGFALLVLEMTQRTPALPVAWSAMMAPLVIVALGLVVWRTTAPPEGAGDEPVFALLGLVATGALAAAVLLSMRSESYGWRASVGRGAGGGGAAGLPEPLPVPNIAPETSQERER